MPIDESGIPGETCLLKKLSDREVRRRRTYGFLRLERFDFHGNGNTSVPADIQGERHVIG